MIRSYAVNKRKENKRQYKIRYKEEKSANLYRKCRKFAFFLNFKHSIDEKYNTAE